MIVVDDALLGAVLAGTAPGDVAAAFTVGDIATTGSWYWRLSRALRDQRSAGALSRSFGMLSPSRQAAVLASVERLPPEIALPSLRRLVPVMTALDVGRQLNLLTAEAVAAAVVLDASIAVTTTSPLMSQSCDRLGIDLRVLTI
ncbi:MAG TPA: hypothetical protein VM262_17560 [Acidimicrobiales bacterium]|nr:hypothetical protein [Acidimicrobiales bacterium]